MKELILVRYGQYVDGSLTDKGADMMREAAQRVKDFLAGVEPFIISATPPRAVQSAHLIAQAFGTSRVDCYGELYAADEDGELPDCSTTALLLETLGKEHPVIIAVASREYIETLPTYILKQLRPDVKEIRTRLERGEALVLNYETATISYLR